MLVSLLVEQHENPKKRASSIQELIMFSPDESHHIMDQFSQQNDVNKSSKGTEHHVAVDINACARKSQPVFETDVHESEKSPIMLPPPPPLLMLNLPTIHHEGPSETSTLSKSIEHNSLDTTESESSVPASPLIRRGPVKLPSRAIAKV